MAKKSKNKGPIKVTETQTKPENSNPGVPGEDVKAVDKVLADGPSATLELGRVPKEEKPVVRLTKDEAIAPATAEAKMFKEVQDAAAKRGKKASIHPITGAIILV